MNASTHHSPSTAAVRLPAANSRQARRGAFALVVTLLILSLLIIVAVSYLSSMVSERQTANAYTSKARAEQAAQAGVDSAMAILSQSFRDFPDSATVWDTQQSKNSGSPYNSAIVNAAYNEGTSLYLRAVEAGGAANPVPRGVPAPGATPVPANDPSGNDPNNPACKNFVLPLISGVPLGQARLVSNKGNIFPDAMKLDVADSALQNYTDLNVRRYAGDLQGVIGSPPDWTTSGAAPVGPKPARAYWVNLKDNSARLTGRYAFWIEDQSFRTNVNHVGNDTVRADNAADGKSVLDTSTGRPRSVLPQDVALAGILADFDGNDASTHAGNVIDTRNVFPVKFLPDPLAFTHDANSATGAATFPTLVSDGLRYLTTTQSGALNLTRHGTQRLNLNATTTIDAANPVTMSEIRKLVETIRFHLPNFGQRFYRTTNPDPIAPLTITPTAKGASLNKPNDVLSDYAEIYLYKTAANLRDYIDSDLQPTMIVKPSAGRTIPTLAPATAPVLLFGSDGSGGDGPNYMWAQGKEAAPFLQETMVRYRPSVTNGGTKYSLTVDYYLEFWNMTDKDISADQLGSGPFVRVANQQSWHEAYIARPTGGSQPIRSAEPEIRGVLATNDSDGIPPWDPPIQPASPPQAARDFNIDIRNDVYQGSNPGITVPRGVIFKAGVATVVTTDPDYASVINSQAAYGGQKLSSAGLKLANIYYCSKPGNIGSAKRIYHGDITLPVDASKLRGIMPASRGTVSAAGTYLDYETEIILGNSLGYIDCANGSVCISTGSTDGTRYAAAGNTSGNPPSTNGYNFTWTATGDLHNDYLHGGTLGGNGITPSQLGDPRTNNEQLKYTTFSSTSYPNQPDQSRYAAPGQTDMPTYSLGTLNSKYLQPIGPTIASGVANPLVAKAIAWGDYFDWKDHNYPTLDLAADTAPAVIADSPLTSIGQLGDLFDSLRVIGTTGTAPRPDIESSRGGGRTLKIGQRDDRYWYDPASNPSPNNAVDNVPSSNGWASWRLTDVFGIADALELPARVNLNGAARDGGAALRAALTGFKFQPQTQIDASGQVKDPLVHGADKLAGTDLKILPADATGVSKLVSQIRTRLDPLNRANVNTPFGPFFERGELGELENTGTSSIALFGKNVLSPFVVSTDLAATAGGVKIDLNHTVDRGREELFRRLVELTCTRGDTFTVYAVGQSLVQTDINKTPKITGTHRLRVTFRLVPKRYTDAARTTLEDFHPGYKINPDGSSAGATTVPDPDANRTDFNHRFDKPDLYDVQVLEVNTL